MKFGFERNSTTDEFSSNILDRETPKKETTKGRQSRNEQDIQVENIFDSNALMIIVVAYGVVVMAKQKYLS